MPGKKKGAPSKSSEEKPLSVPEEKLDEMEQEALRKNKESWLEPPRDYRGAGEQIVHDDDHLL